MHLTLLITIFLHAASYSTASRIPANPDPLERPISSIQLKIPLTLSNLDSEYDTNPYHFKDNVRAIEDVHEELDEPYNKILFTEATDDERSMFPANQLNSNSLKGVLSKTNNEKDSNKRHNNPVNLNKGAENVGEIKPASLDQLNSCISLLSEENNGRILISDTNYETSLYTCREIFNNLKDLIENNVNNRNIIEGKSILKYRNDHEDINRDEVNFDDKCSLKCQKDKSSNEDEEATSNNQEIHLSPKKWSRNGYIQWLVPNDARRNWMVINEEYPA